MFKVIVVGSSNVGKTSIVNRFVGDRFDPNYKATVAADFQTKILEIRGNEIRLQMWDLVGMDTNFASINKQFCRSASGAIFVGDLTDPGSIEQCADWKAQVENLVEGTPIPMILAGNKCDVIQELEEEGQTEFEPLQTLEGLEEFAQANGFIGAWMTSAKQDINIIPMVASLTRQMLIKELTEQAASDQNGQNGEPKQSFALSGERPVLKDKKSGCCN